jgi:hypothetical protein
MQLRSHLSSSPNITEQITLQPLHAISARRHQQQRLRTLCSCCTTTASFSDAAAAPFAAAATPLATEINQDIGQAGQTR